MSYLFLCMGQIEALLTYIYLLICELVKGLILEKKKKITFFLAFWSRYFFFRFQGRGHRWSKTAPAG